MKKVVFLAPYPNSQNIREGMMQRVAAIDSLFSDDMWEKIYVVPTFKSFKNSKQVVSSNTVIYNLSIWSSRTKILDLINSSDTLYCHSLYGISICGLLYWSNIQAKNTIWDVHGIIPEELSFASESWIKIKLFNLLESIVIKKIAKIITVTKAMKDHLLTKYPNCSAQFYTYAILPLTIDREDNVGYNKNEKIVVLYAGNTQKYQNIPMMLENIATLSKFPNIHFEILTGNLDEMKGLLKQYGLDNQSNIAINSVAPDELSKYYSMAHYGYILRDDTDVNNVACPTKIVEYLAYGLFPIVIQPKIGDFDTMGYEYIKLSDTNMDVLKPQKSVKNANIYIDLLSKSNTVMFMLFIID